MANISRVSHILRLISQASAEAATEGVLEEEAFLEILQNSREDTCALGQSFIKIETLAQVFSCEFCEFSKSTFFTEHLCTTASLQTSFQTFC